MILAQHLLVSAFVGLVGAYGVYSLGLGRESAIVFAAMLVLANGIDVDHYRGSVNVLARGAVVLCEQDFKEYKPYLKRGLPHNLSIYKGVMVGLLGIMVGYTLHLKLDGVL